MKILQRPDPEPLHVLAAQLRLWLLDVCVWLSARLGMKMPRELRILLREDIRDALFSARLLIFMLAMTRRKRTVLRHHTERPSSTPPGFRRIADAPNPFRLLKRAVKLRGRGIHARIAALREMLSNLDRWIRRVLKHVHAGPHGVCFVLRGAVAEVLRALATPAPTCADTS